MIYTKNNGFTLVELIVSLTILGIFALLAGQGFVSILSSLNNLRAIGEEQEYLLYDNFSIDDYLSNAKSVKAISFSQNSVTNTGYLFEHEDKKYNYPFSFLSFHDSGNGYNKLSFKNILLLNDIISYNSNIYYTEPGLNTIKNFDTNVILNNIGTGELNNPSGLLLHDSKLYIADTGNSCIRYYDSNLSDCIVGQKAISGDSNELLIGPTYMAHTGSYMYISDTYQNKIRKVDLSNTGNIIDVFGTGDFGSNLTDTLSFTGIKLNLPTGLAINGNKLYVSDTGNNRILELDINSGTGKILLGNGEEDSIYLGWEGFGLKNIPISSPTGLKINDSKLYFAESTTGIIKSYNFVSKILMDELGNLGNLAYFGDFERVNTGNSYAVVGGSSLIVGEDIVIPYGGEKSLEIISENNGDVDFSYGFSGVTLKEDQSLSLSFALKTNSGSYDISYGGTEANTFDSNYLTGSIGEDWSIFNLDYYTSQLKNGVMIKIINTGSGDSFYIDDINISLNNLVMDSTQHKYESNFKFISGLFVGAKIYFSDIYSGKNYNTSDTDFTLEKYNLINSVPINLDYMPYFPDDYRSKADLFSFFVGILKPYNFATSIGIDILVESRNGAVFYKNISIK